MKLYLIEFRSHYSGEDTVQIITAKSMEIVKEVFKDKVNGYTLIKIKELGDA